MRILVWNCQGSSWPGFISQALFYITSLRLDFICLVDTKATLDGAKNIASRLQFYNFCIVLAIGQCGGLILLWKSSNFSLDFISLHRRFIHCKVHDFAIDKRW